MFSGAVCEKAGGYMGREGSEMQVSFESILGETFFFMSFIFHSVS